MLRRQNLAKYLALFDTGLGITPFDFDLSLATFTPSMAVRAGKLFAGAPFVQGDYDGSGTGDLLSFVPGSNVSGYFYQTIDLNQGTIEFFWTPELSRDIGHTNDEYLVYINTNYFIRYEQLNNRITTKWGQGQNYTSFTSVAGTTYAIVFRWDVNKVDGTNYQCFSINDVHDFGGTAITLQAASIIYIGNLNDTLPTNSRIEGFHIHRRVWYDGTYGTDIGNGDEIAAHYNGGAFADPSEVVKGSWDCVFALPTSGTPGALVTG